MTASFRTLASKFRPTYFPIRRWVGTMTPRKQLTNGNASEANIAKEEAEPTVAFGRPKPLPPLLGPIVALSMMQSWTNKWDDNNDD